LRSVNGRISEALALQRQVPGATAPRKFKAITQPPGESFPASDVDPRLLREFDAFRKFSSAEITRLLRLMRRWNLKKDTVVFTEGSAGGSCFIVLEGLIDVSISSRGESQLLAALAPGSVFGQVSVIDNVPRSATCSARADTTLLEMESGPCERLLRGGSRTAIKFLATLNEGLISALRGADLRLMQIDRESLSANRAGHL
jgi:CRP-like cAMP-binding protein